MVPDACGRFDRDADVVERPQAGSLKRRVGVDCNGAVRESCEGGKVERIALAGVERHVVGSLERVKFDEASVCLGHAGNSVGCGGSGEGRERVKVDFTAVFSGNVGSSFVIRRLDCREVGEAEFGSLAGHGEDCAVFVVIGRFVGLRGN